MTDVPSDHLLRARLGAAIRRLGHEVVGHHAEPDLLEAATDQVEALSEAFCAGGPRSREASTFTYDWDAPIPDGAEILTHADRPVSGVASPWGLDLDARREGEHVVARFTLHAAHEGAPERSHGGIVAALFDDVLGMLLQVHHHRAFTGELTVRYEAPTPLHRPLVMRAWVHHHEGRKLYLHGELHDGDQRLATAKATFIKVDAVHLQP